MEVYMSIISRIRKKIMPTPQEKEFARWFADEGDKTLRLNYDLDSDSVVFDLGGYKGDFAKEIYDRYESNIYVFEPVPEYAASIANRFYGNDKIKSFDFGLADKAYSTDLRMDDDGSSMFIGDQSECKVITINLRPIVEFIEENSIYKIDLMKINIEGGEYDLLDEIISSGLINRISNIQVQFHNFVPDSVNRMESIHKKLEITHRTTYKYEFVWENWEKR